MKKEPIPNINLKQARLDRRLSLAGAAELAGVSIEAYSRWEYGTQVPRLSSLALLCEGFGCTPEEVGFMHLVRLQDAQAAGEKPMSVIRLTEEQAALIALLLQGDDVIMFDEAKRRTLEQLFVAMGVMTTPLLLPDPEPWERIRRKSSDIDEQTFDHFESLLKTCREMSNGSELHIADRILPQFLPRLVQLAPYQPRAASLAAQGLQLRSILSAHRLRLADKITYCQEAVTHAKLARDANVLVASLLELAVAYQYGQRPMEALQSYQEALFYCKDSSPVLQARTYVETGAAFAKCGRSREALFYLGLAYDTLPDYPEDDPFFPISDYCGHYTVSLYDGIIHLDLGNSANALNGFDKYKSAHSRAVVPERIRLEIVNHQGRAAILSKNLEQYVLCLDDGLSGAVTLDSRKRYDEAVTIFQQDMPRAWMHEQRIKELAERYHLALPS